MRQRYREFPHALCSYIYTVAHPSHHQRGFLGGSDGKESTRDVGGLGLIPGLRRFLGEGNGDPPQYSCLENSMDRGAWRATAHGVAKSRTLLSNFHSLTHLLTHTPAINIPTRAMRSLQSVNLHQLITVLTVIQSTQFTLGFTLGGIHSVGPKIVE